MLEVTPFQAIRYDFSKNRDLSTRIAPPYDVLDQEDKAALLKRSDRNIVAIDLPHVPPKSAGPAEVYRKAADTLKSWLADGTLVREPKPAIYLYHQTFTFGGRTYTRKKFIARVKLCRFDEGVVLPHEQTFGGPKEDRLALMKATKCNLSAIFGLYSDPEGTIDTAFAATAGRQPDAFGTLEEVENKLWIVDDPATTSTVTSAMAQRQVFIADGHHRYGTALMYRDWLAEQAGGSASRAQGGGSATGGGGGSRGSSSTGQGGSRGSSASGQQGGSLPADHPANFVMFVLASMDDPGCLIWPYHRALAGIELDALLAAWKDGCATCGESDADLTLVDRTGRRQGVRFTNRAVLAKLAPDECDAWRKLDTAYLHRYLIDELLHGKGGAGAARSAGGGAARAAGSGAGPAGASGAGKSAGGSGSGALAGGSSSGAAAGGSSSGAAAGGGTSSLSTGGGQSPAVRFVKSEKAALETARTENGVALLVRATPMAHLKAVSEAGGLMPQKSTYFYPKLVTGLTVNGLE